MDKKTFLTTIKNRGYAKTRNEALAEMQKFRDKGGVFDDEQAPAQPTVNNQVSVPQSQGSTRGGAQPIPMSDEQMRTALIVKNTGDNRMNPPVGNQEYYSRRKQQAVMDRQPMGVVANVMGSGALGVLQGATGGLSKKAFVGNEQRKGSSVNQAENVYSKGAEGNTPAYTIGELLGGLWTGGGLGKVAAGSRIFKSAPQIAKFAAKSTAEAIPWISKAGVERGGKAAGKEAVLNLAIDAGLGVVGRGVRRGIQAIIPMTSRVGKEALEHFATREGKNLIRKFAGKGDELSDYVIENLDNFDDFLPEYKRVGVLLEKMPPIKKTDLYESISKLRIKKPLGVENKINEDILNFLQDINGHYPGEFLPASDYKQIIKSLDNGLFGKWGKESNALISRLKMLRKDMRVTLENVAEKSGNKEYTDIMREIHHKLNVKKAIEKKIGTSADRYSRSDRTERFLLNLTRMNKKGSNVLADEIGKVFGSDVKAKAKAVKYARELGINVNECHPATFNTLFMRSLVGGISGGATLGILGGMSGGEGFDKSKALGGIVAGAALTSPRAGAAVYTLSKNIKAKHLRDIAKTRHTIGEQLGR